MVKDKTIFMDYNHVRWQQQLNEHVLEHLALNLKLCSPFWSQLTYIVSTLNSQPSNFRLILVTINSQFVYLNSETSG